MKRLVAVLVLGSLIASCGPIMQTNYQFTPPKSESGRNCIVHCDSSKNTCEQLEQMKYELCEQRAEQEYYNCQRWEAAADRQSGTKRKWYEGSCYRDSCSSNIEGCAINYRICYQNCGGQVISETICVSNCDELK